MVKICLDPGHGGIDPGVVNGGRYEKTDVLRLALAVKTRLEDWGIGVLLTRETDRAISIAERCRLANEAECAYFLSLHRDAAGADAYGISMWVHSRANAATVEKAQQIHRRLLAVAPTYDRRVNKGTPQSYADFGVNVQTTMASALLELGFLTNEADNARFDAHFDRYAEAVAQGIAEIVGVQPPPDRPDEPEEETRLEELLSELEAVLNRYREVDD